MNDDQSTTGTGTNPAPGPQVPRPAVPVMDVVPPSAEPSVVAAPPEEITIPPVSEAIAEQLVENTSPTPAPTEVPAASPAVSEPVTEPLVTSAAPSNLINEELEKQKLAPAEAGLPQPKNPGHRAAVATVVGVAILLIVAILAFVSTKK